MPNQMHASICLKHAGGKCAAAGIRLQHRQAFTLMPGPLLAVIVLLQILRSGCGQSFAWKYETEPCPSGHFYDTAGLMCEPCANHEVGDTEVEVAACLLLHKLFSAEGELL
jgi:hypothetical protein